MMTRRIARVGDSSSPLLQQFEAAVRRFELPVEIQDVALSSRPEAVLSETQGVLLATGVAAQPWLKAAGAGLSLGTRLPSSTLIWPFEDTQRSRVARGGPAEMWIETSCLSRAGMEATIRSALLLANERGTGAPIWVYAGWGEIEDQAVSLAREISQDGVAVKSIEEIAQSNVPAPVLLGLGRTALPLARWKGAQGWTAWVDRGVAIAQAATPEGATSVLPFWLDRLGFVREAEELERTPTA